MKPVEIYNEVVIPSLMTSGFQPLDRQQLNGDEDEQHRFYDTFTFTRLVLDGQRGDAHGSVTRTVDLIGIPMGVKHLVICARIIIDDENTNQRKQDPKQLVEDDYLALQFSLNGEEMLSAAFIESNFGCPNIHHEHIDDQIRWLVDTFFARKLVEILSMQLDELPDAIKLDILSYLHPRDLANVSMVSKRWYSLCQDEYLWMKLFRRDFGFGKTDPDWKEFYRKTYAETTEIKQRRAEYINLYGGPFPIVYPSLKFI